MPKPILIGANALPRAMLALVSLAVMSFLSPTLSADASDDPAAARLVLEEVASAMVSALQDPTVRQDVNKIQQLVVEVLVPQIDFRVSSNLVLGEYWATATEQQRSAFIDEFQVFLVRFYAGALASYIDSSEVPGNVMSFDQDPRIKDERQLIVPSIVGQPDADSIAVDYRMFYRDSWKIIDVSVAGISMVQSYRSNFTSTVRQKGIDVLIAQLQQRNQSFSAN
ncbi:MAG: phospholipid transport system substrate-binding protein [Gammaproteobacteria bacterium]|jgi:phospholipid transport system substrate-binding protein